MDEDDEEPMLGNFPFAFRFGAVGFGVGVGCGMGIGFGGPLNLGGIPGVGSAVSGMSSGLGQVSHLLGGVGQLSSQTIRSLGIKGLDAGVGCGVGIGYGFGAGLMLKPSAIESLSLGIKRTAGWVTRSVQQKLSGKEEDVDNPSEGGDGGLFNSFDQGGGNPSLLNGMPFMAAPAGDNMLPPALMSGKHSALPDVQQTQHQSDMADLMRTVLRQQEEISRLQRQTQSLRKAFCAVEPQSHVCSINADDDIW